jgi:hypothetical protein
MQSLSSFLTILHFLKAVLFFDIRLSKERTEGVSLLIKSIYK